MTADTGPGIRPELGVFARVFPAGPPDEVAAAVSSAGYTCTQLNLSAVGRPTLDRQLTDDAADAIAAAFRSHGVRIWGLSGSFNAVHPDLTKRRADTEACQNVIRRAPALGAEVVTLCTGTRDAADMWRHHIENGTSQAWTDLLDTLSRLLPVAAEARVKLGVEPEPGNVVRDADAAARLLAELGPDAAHVVVVLDPANLLTPETLPRQESILTHAFEVLGERTAAVHAKDVVGNGYAAAGVGGMDYDHVMRLHRRLPRPVPVIAQDVLPADAARVRTFLVAAADRAARAGGAGR
jgi:sugar phosphate isomerase/epimerase